MKLDAAEKEEECREGGGRTDDRAPRLNERAAFQSIGGNSCRWQCCWCCCCCCCSVAVATKRGRQQQQLLLLLRMLLCLIKRLPRCEAATLVVTFARPIDTHLNDDNDAAGAALACLAPAPACLSSCCTASLAQPSLTLSLPSHTALQSHFSVSWPGRPNAIVVVLIAVAVDVDAAVEWGTHLAAACTHTD